MSAVVSLGVVTLSGCEEGTPPLEEEQETDTEAEVEIDPEDPAKEDLEVLVESTCAQVDQCNCGEVVFGDDDCTNARSRLWNDRLDYGRANDLEYDRQCVARQIQTVPNLGCGYAGDQEIHLCDNFCSVFHGSVELGQACTGFDEVVSNCAQGLVCSSGTCQSPCSTLTGLDEGQQCSSEEAGQFDDCSRGLFCDQFTTNVCLRLPGLGEFCDFDCGENLYCSYQTSTCLAAVGEGADCSGAECVDGLTCVWRDGPPPDYGTQTCIRPPSEGEACPDFRCATGLFCSEGICASPPLAGQPCPEGACAEGLFCDWNINVCVNPPEGIGQPCPQGLCAYGLWCDQSQDPEGECLEVKPLADPCTGHSQCGSGYCPRGYCLPRPALGEDCADTLACASGLVCNGATCQLAQARGPAVCIYDGW